MGGIRSYIIQSLFLFAIQSRVPRHLKTRNWPLQTFVHFFFSPSLFEKPVGYIIEHFVTQAHTFGVELWNFPALVSFSLVGVWQGICATNVKKHSWERTLPLYWPLEIIDVSSVASKNNGLCLIDLAVQNLTQEFAYTSPWMLWARLQNIYLALKCRSDC